MARQSFFEPHKHDPSEMIPGRYILVGFFSFVIPPFILFWWFIAKMNAKPARKNTATILVIGDIGRSPRMMYHAESLAKKGWETVIVGYNDTPPIPSLLELPHVHIHGIPTPIPFILNLPWILKTPIRIIYQIFSILYIIFLSVPIHTEFLFVQNPPSIPTLALAQLVSLVSGSKLVVDWHNEGWSILAMRLGKGNVLVKIARWFESYFGRSAYAHLFVTSALQQHLTREWHLESTFSSVLYDRPPHTFHPTDPMSKHALFIRLREIITPPIPLSWKSDPKLDTKESTLFTTISKAGLPENRNDRPALLVSSTSWTPDEDFDILVEALDYYQAEKNKLTEVLPKLLIIITGKGNLQKKFLQKVKARESQDKWSDILVRTIFLDARDYPTLLGCGDLGISLHTSSSGRDLPMKIVDMFGCGVPVLAKRFECLDELVKEGRNGRGFDTSEELGQEIVSTLEGFPNSKNLDSLKSYFTAQQASLSSSSRPSSRIGVSKSSSPASDEWSSWEQNWDRVVYRGILRRSG